MAKPEWGVKRICSACGTKYYDFNNSPIICPSCNTEFDPDVYLKSRKGKNLSPKVVADNNDNIANLDDIEVENDEEVVSDDDPILEINKDDKDEDNEGDIAINDDINFIEDTDGSEEDETSVEIIEDQKD
ncbi:TIGR02300 family protein [Alphaproteobacteria bacterium]|nr:TIGR02300 family protein [Alphaproteobacteria bacterium]